MPDNPLPVLAPFFALPKLRVLRLSGCDAGAFAQAQFMNDVAALAVGRFQWNGWLTPKGRVQALFALARPADDSLLLVGCFDPDALRTALSRFVFRSRVAIDAPPGWTAGGCLLAPAAARGAALAVDADGTLELDMSGAVAGRTLRVGPGAHAAPDPDGEDAWHALDLAHGWPAIPGADLASWTPQQLSLERLSAYSVRKGCYPGQEIVARTHFLGRAKRRAVLLEGNGVSVGESVSIDGADVGSVIASTSTSALAVVTLERPGGGPATVAGRPALEKPLRDGLER